MKKSCIMPRKPYSSSEVTTQGKSETLHPRYRKPGKEDEVKEGTITEEQSLEGTKMGDP